MASSSSGSFSSPNEQNLGLLIPEGWTVDPEAAQEPPPKRKRLSLHKDAAIEQPPVQRFLTREEEAALAEKCVPKNTATSTKWAVANFESWRKNRNKRFSSDRDRQVPDCLLLSQDSVALSKWLSLYVAEARKQDGTVYPPKSLYLLLTGLLRYMRSKNPRAPNFLDTAAHEFQSFHNTMDNVFRQRRAEGVSNVSKSTETFSKADIEQLWASGALDIDNPKGLLRAVFFLNGISFCLRGGEEHRNQKLSQLKREENPPKCLY